MDRRYQPLTPQQQAQARKQLYATLAEQPGLSIPDTLRLIRLSLRLTRADLAKLSGLSVRYISQLEKGEGNPTLAAIESVLKPFGLRLGCLLSPANPS
ncbi:MAG: helix-turn-helix transcriptional regulator [Pseudomonadota bacterium]